MRGETSSGRIGASARGQLELRRIASDFAVLFVALATILLAVGGIESRAHAVFLPVIDSPAGLEGPVRAGLNSVSASGSHPQFHVFHTTPRQAHLLLGAAVAAILAFNLAFWRHLRRAYASPRRRRRRRG